jgi:hypothetical protein
MFTEPPSVDGTVGPQIVPAAPLPALAPTDDAVPLATFEEEAGASPGSCSGV